MTTDTHDPYNCRILFLSRLVLGVSRMGFNSWDIHHARTEEIRVSECQYCFTFIIRGGEWKGKIMQRICTYVLMMLNVDLLVRCICQ